ncbi:MAG: flagellar protein G [Candidatus Methanoperedens sp.]|nr:flagellar protein G [Candidatus Methanoperedens sp.]MCZ7396371.1 flagellar protein G [Candidatus Methanoperedens sp.]
MAGEAITQLIFFIGAIVVAVGVIGVLTTNVHSITASYGMSSQTLADQLKTDITIINDPAAIPYDTNLDNYSFFVKNTGKNTLDPTAVSMFIDGNYVNTTKKWTIMDNTSSSLWYPTQVLRLNYTYSPSPYPSPGSHTVRVVAQNGVSDTLPFTT